MKFEKINYKFITKLCEICLLFETKGRKEEQC